MPADTCGKLCFAAIVETFLDIQTRLAISDVLRTGVWNWGSGMWGNVRQRQAASGSAHDFESKRKTVVPTPRCAVAREEGVRQYLVLQ